MAEKTIATNDPTDLQICNDVFTLSGTQCRGAGVIARGDDVGIHFWRVPSGTISSSFHSEKSALMSVISSLHHHEDWSLASITSD